MAIIIAAAVAFIAVFVGPLIFTGASFGEEAQPVRLVVTPCHTVTAKVWNKRVRLGRQITGRPGFSHLTKHKQCKSKYRDLGVLIRAARRDCLKKVVNPNHGKPPTSKQRNRAGVTGASFYSYGDSGGLVGACGTFLPSITADYSFAVLGTGNVTSRCGQSFYFHRHGVTRWGFQADTGGGGGDAAGFARTFDFWNPPAPTKDAPHRPGLARDLGLTSAGLGAVAYSRHNCWAR